MKLWLAGRVVAGSHLDGPPRWMLHGVYSSEAMAADRCRDRLDFMAPVEVDQEIPDGVFAGAVFPRDNVPEGAA